MKGADIHMKAKKKAPVFSITQKNKFLLAIAVILLFVFLCAGLFVGEVYQTVRATKDYNLAVQEFNLAAKNYNTAVEQTCIDNIRDLPVVMDLLCLENEAVWENVKVVFGANSKDKINADTATIYDMIGQLEQATAIVTQITAPEGDWVLNRISQVSDVTGAQAVTKELDPDGLLGKEGGFSACVYFTVSQIDASTVPGDSIVAKGTDAGGAVEVYPTLKDAEARCEYLSGFDGTILYSGSYAIVGTMVVRTSYKLTNEQQLELTKTVVSALTVLPANVQ
jgi:hypothetical protein